MFKSGLYLTFFSLVSAALGLLRSIIVAHFISVEDFGIAGTFAMAMAIIDMSANIGINRLIVQSKDGHDADFQASLQGFQVFRGFVGAGVILVLSHPLANLFHTPTIAWAYQVMAIVPIIKGFSHLDMNRFQRESRFMPGITSEVIAQALSTLLGALFGYWLHDYRAMIFAILGQNLVYFVASQLFAVRPYRLAWNTQYIKGAFNFGWPLLINGFLMFGVFHGERMVIGNQLGLTVLGWFSAANMLTLMTAGIIGKVVDTMGLPLLSRHQDDAHEFHKKARTVMEATCLIGVSIAIGFTLLGAPVLHLLFGAKHANGTAVLVLLSVMYAIRTARTGPAIVSISRKDTLSPMLANVMRSLFIPLAFLAVHAGFGIVAVIYAGIVGELAAYLVSLWKLVERLGFMPHELARAFFSSMAVIAILLLYEYLWPAQAFALASWYSLVIITATASYIYQLRSICTIATTYLNKYGPKFA